MKHKVETLEGALLDRAVALCETDVVWWTPFAYSTEWDRGGPIIEREGLDVTVLLQDTDNIEAGKPPQHIGAWWAERDGIKGEGGPTPLIAAMRAYVASKFGDEVELP